MFNYERHRVLIWGKTAPELSDKYTETVCTGGVLEDGTPVRLYPIPFRYLEGDQKFSTYQWIEVDIAKDVRDKRPESYHVKKDSVECFDAVPTTKDEWGLRAEYIFKNPSWLFNSVEELCAKERQDSTSLGIVEPKEILKISIKARTDEERVAFDKKFEDLLVRNEAQRSQQNLFDDFTVPELKKLPFVDARLQLQWRCNGENCNTHNTQVLDWGLIELQRRKGIDAAKSKLEEICDLTNFALKFYMGNIKSHPERFTIVGLWYPKRASDRLF